jgi:hypothetical protein
MTRSLHVDRFHLGVCYYPEHWPESLWADGQDSAAVEKRIRRAKQVTDYAEISEHPILATPGPVGLRRFSLQTNILQKANRA